MSQKYQLTSMSPLLLDPAIAKAVGVSGATIIQQVHYWCEKRIQVYDDEAWVYNTYPGWQEQFWFWSVDTVERNMVKLEKSGLLIVGNYNSRRYDRTKPELQRELLDVALSNALLSDKSLTYSIPDL